MYLGQLVELGDSASIFHSPAHPYTRALSWAIPEATPEAWFRGRAQPLSGDIPSPINVPPGCPFHPRCWLYEQLGRPEACRTQSPPMLPVGATGHLSACHFREQGRTRQRRPPGREHGPLAAEVVSGQRAGTATRRRAIAAPEPSRLERLTPRPAGAPALLSERPLPTRQAETRSRAAAAILSADIPAASISSAGVPEPGRVAHCQVDDPSRVTCVAQRVEHGAADAALGVVVLGDNHAPAGRASAATSVSASTGFTE